MGGASSVIQQSLDSASNKYCFSFKSQMQNESIFSREQSLATDENGKIVYPRPVSRSESNVTVDTSLTVQAAVKSRVFEDENSSKDFCESGRASEVSEPLETTTLLRKLDEYLSITHHNESMVR